MYRPRQGVRVRAWTPVVAKQSTIKMAQLYATENITVLQQSRRKSLAAGIANMTMTSHMLCLKKSRNVLKLGDTGSIVVGRTSFKPATYRTTQDRRQRSNHLSQELSSFNTYRKYLIHAESKSAVFILIVFSS